MFKWKSSVWGRWSLFATCLFAAWSLAFPAIAQTPQVESEEVARVGAHIACQCGACKESANCPMSRRGCEFCSPTRARIYKMQKAGMSDQAIIDQFKKEYGDKIYLNDPSPFYWIVPMLAVMLGLAAIFAFVRRYLHRAPVAAEAHDPALDRFHDEIEKETAGLE